uniref:DDE Tnp4 domain-containing protein n=1 Tax=Macrostomum lignano TaxID=282301 RepID=A0A1I8F7F3_9PLAT
CNHTLIRLQQSLLQAMSAVLPLLPGGNRKILIPLDGSSHAEEAYRFYMETHPSRNGDHIVHRAHHRRAAVVAVIFIAQRLQYGFHCRAQQEAAAKLWWTSPGAPNCHMIVMGQPRSRRRSVSDYVMHNSRLAVTVVPAKRRFSTSGPASGRASFRRGFLENST